MERRQVGWLVRIVAVAVLAVAGAACGDDAGGPETGAQPNTESSDFDADALAGIQLPQPAEALSPPVTAMDDGAQVVTRSFSIPGQSPAEVLAEFASLLPDAGWTVATEPEEFGKASWKGSWLREGEELEITASPMRSAQEDGGQVTQFNLVLRPGA